MMLALKIDAVRLLGNLFLEPSQNDAFDAGLEATDAARFGAGRRCHRRTGALDGSRRASGLIPGGRTRTARRRTGQRSRVQTRVTAAQRRRHLPAPFAQ